MRKRHFAILALALFLTQLSFASGFDPEHGQHAMVATVHPEASRVGVDIMRTRPSVG